MLVFGIDTGSTNCGYAVLRVDGQDLALMECGVMHASAPANDNGAKWTRMRSIGRDFDDLLNQYGGGLGDVCGLESAYIPVGRTHGVETLAEVRGVLGYLARSRDLSVVTVSPSTVKKSVTGYGRADKEQVAEAVRVRFKLRSLPPPDATDAVGVALAVANGATK